MAIIMGIDQSFTSTGISIIHGEKRHFEVISTEKGDSHLDVFFRASIIKNKIASLVKKYRPNMVVLEGLGFASTGNATRNLAGLQFLIADVINEAGIPLEIVTPTSLKKFACHGKASKKEMFDALPEDVKAEIAVFKATKGRYDVTDAYWLASHGKRTYDDIISEIAS